MPKRPTPPPPPPPPPRPSKPSRPGELSDSIVQMADEVGGLRRRSGLRWALLFLVLVAGGGAAFYFLQYEPLMRAHTDLETRASEAETARDEAVAATSELEEERDRVQSERDELRTERNALQAERDQLVGRAGPPADEAALARIGGVRERLVVALASETHGAGGAHIGGSAAEVVVELKSERLFSPRTLDLSDSGRGLLEAIVGALGDGGPVAIRITAYEAGAEVPAPLRTRFATSWDLASARAIAVVRALAGAHEIPGEHLTAVGVGHHRPRPAAEGRPGNARLELAVTPVVSDAPTTPEEQAMQ